MKARYYKGRQFEYKVKKFLEALGFAVFRCAGSKPVDLVVLKAGLKPMLIECKTTSNIPKDQRDIEKALAERAGAELIIVTKSNFDEFKKKMLVKYAESLSSTS
ncbi:MAG: hypothetical protein DRJ60_00365 [Thermoprotei archaeon]|nr:MAG: hypothetical protein DRJ60_00365 [Thermoprotei archaeon]